MSYVAKAKTGINGVLKPIASTLYGTCITAAHTNAKIVECPDFDKLFVGVTIHVKFTNGNTSPTPTMNVNLTGEFDIVTGTTADVLPINWQAGQVISFTYDGTSWVINDWTITSSKVYQWTSEDYSAMGTSALLTTINTISSGYGDIVTSPTLLYDHTNNVLINTLNGDAITISPTDIVTTGTWGGVNASLSTSISTVNSSISTVNGRVTTLNTAVTNLTSTVNTINSNYATKTQVNAKLNLTGGTLTGNLVVGTSNTNKNLTVNGTTTTKNLTVNNTATINTLTVNGRTNAHFVAATGLDVTGNVTVGNGGACLEINGTNPFIDFHRGGSSIDFTARIINDGDGKLSFYKMGNPGQYGQYIACYAASWNKASSIHVKKNIEDITMDEAKKILELRPVSFDYINGDDNQRGLIAEEVYKICPEMVDIPEGYEGYDENEPWKVPSIDYSKFVPYLIKMVQYLYDKVKED